MLVPWMMLGLWVVLLGVVHLLLSMVWGWWSIIAPVMLWERLSVMMLPHIVMIPIVDVLSPRVVLTLLTLLLLGKMLLLLLLMLLLLQMMQILVRRPIYVFSKKEHHQEINYTRFFT